VAEEQTLARERSQGPVTGLWERPANAFAAYVMAHGAGAGMRHRFMQGMAEALAAAGVATLRFDFPYTEKRRRRPDPQPVLEAYVRSACAEAGELAPELPLFAGGKSMGGRMSSNAAAREPLPGVRGLVFLGFPLHARKSPSLARAEHLRAVELPLLFVQGTRDELAEIGRVRELAASLGSRATLHELAGGDHSFALPKSAGRSEAEIHAALAAAIAAWMRPLSSPSR
jgi:predicted alpha/beta-hydrolase family hydrolase